MPTAAAVTTPVDAMVATAVFELVHVPPVLVVANVVVEPTHTDDVPVIAATTGSGLTVTAVAGDVVEHPEALVTSTV